MIRSTLILSLAFSAVLATPALAEDEEKAKGSSGSAGAVNSITVSGDKAAEVSGNLKSGKKIALDWAEKSNVACFPATRFEMFDGNHVFYRISMPAQKSMKIQLTPVDKSKLINLYALRQEAGGSQPVPPNVESVISAEASYPKYAKVGGKKTKKNADDGIRKIDFISLDQPYSILIGVAGAEGLTEGEYKLSVLVEPRK